MQKLITPNTESGQRRIVKDLLDEFSTPVNRAGKTIILQRTGNKPERSTCAEWFFVCFVLLPPRLPEGDYGGPFGWVWIRKIKKRTPNFFVPTFFSTIQLKMPCNCTCIRAGLYQHFAQLVNAHHEWVQEDSNREIEERERERERKLFTFVAKCENVHILQFHACVPLPPERS